ncbi:MAG: alpha-E domain-containing protein, partial [Comamonas sp.]
NLKVVAHEGALDSQRRAGRLLADLQYGQIDEILETGLHAYLTQFLDRVNQLGEFIAKDYLVPEL